VYPPITITLLAVAWMVTESPHAETSIPELVVRIGKSSFVALAVKMIKHINHGNLPDAILASRKDNRHDSSMSIVSYSHPTLLILFGLP
jgi:hypothetical protein